MDRIGSTTAIKTIGHMIKVHTHRLTITDTSALGPGPLATQRITIEVKELLNLNEWKRLLAEIKNIKLNINNIIKKYIQQRCYQVTNNIYGNSKSLNSS